MERMAAICRRGLPLLARSSPLYGSPLRGSHSGALQPAVAIAESWNIPLVSSDMVQKPAAERGMQWIFMGCPGVGKGTYASRLAKLLGIPHISVGDLVRKELSQATPSGQKLVSLANEGKLLPDDVILDLLSKRLEKGVQLGESGFILDGFPRTQSQAGILEQVAEIDLVLNLRLPENILIMKCLGRRICSGCGNNYNLANIDVEATDGRPGIFMPPLLPPPACASKLTVRPDDTEEVVRARLRIYADESKPVEEYYRRQGKLLDFDVAGGIPETWPRLLAALKLDRATETKMAV
eukprot:c24007_g2_i1 orf=482-1366(-)